MPTLAKTLRLVLIAAQLSVLVGSTAVFLLLGLWPGSTATFSLDVLLAVIVSDLLGVNLLALLVFFPLLLRRKIDPEHPLFPIHGLVLGGLFYLAVNVVIDLMLGLGAIWFSSGWFLIAFSVGALFGGIFCLSYKIMLNLCPRLT